MSAFGGLILTNRGRNLQAKVQAGAQLKYTVIKLGDGALGTSVIADLTALKHEVLSLSITKLKAMTGGRATLGFVLRNNNLASGFYFRELGVYAQDPDLGEILYCYGNAANLAEYIPAGGGADIVEKTIDIEILTGNASNVSAIIDNSLVYETPAGAQQKADQAEADAINWAKSFGLGENAKLLDSGTDLNADHNTGFYRGAGLINSPPISPQNPDPNNDGWFFYIHIVHDDGWKQQIAYEFGSGITWTRRKAGESWGAWVEQETTAGAQAKADEAEAQAVNWAKSFGLGVYAANIENQDLNAISIAGFYRGGNLLNAPPGVPQGYLIAVGYDANSAAQLFVSVDGIFSYRHKIYDNVPGGIWQTWQQIETTTGAQAKADAAQANSLSAKPVNILGTTNWNDITTVGNYYVNGGGTNFGNGALNQPLGAYAFGQLIVTANGPTVSQLYVPHQTPDGSDEHPIFFRSKYNAADWGAWSTLASQKWVKSFGLGANSADRIYVQDANALNRTGFYITDAEWIGSPFPDTHGLNQGYLEHQEWGGEGRYGTQTHTQVNVELVKRFRYKDDGNWSEWTIIETQAGAQARADNVKNWAKAFGLGEVAKNTPGLDLNNIKENGFYRIEEGTLNRPFDWGGMIVYGGHYGETVQQATDIINRITYMRTFVNGAGWSAWVAQENVTGSQEKADAAYSNSVDWVRQRGYGDYAQFLTGVDLDTLQLSGFYRINSGRNVPPRVPGDNNAIWHYLIVIGHDTEWTSQIALEYNTGTMFNRVKQGGTWSAWKKFGGDSALSANGQIHVPNQSFVRLGTDTLKTVESGVDVKLTPAERVDRRGEYDANTHRFIPQETGLYSFTGKFNFSANTTSYSYFKIYKNGVLFDTIYTGYGYKLAHISGIFELTQAGSDYYEFYVRHTTTGGAQNTETQLEITKLS